MQDEGWKTELIDHGSLDPAPKADKCETTIGFASPRTIRDYAEGFAPEELRSIRDLGHDDVEAGFCEKASTVYYYRSGHWIQLQGAD